MKKHGYLSISMAALGSLLLATGSAAAPAAAAGNGSPPPPSSYRNACQPGEFWNIGSAIREDIGRDFKSFITGKDQPVLGFANALTYRRFAANEETRALSEYWISRALFQSQLIHVAHLGFASLASRAPDSETAQVQLAALDCMLRISERYPSLEIPQPVYARLGERGQNPTVWEAAHRLLRLQLSADKPQPAEIDKTLALMAGSPSYSALGRALWHSKRNEYSKTMQEMKRFFETPNPPAALKPYSNTAHMIYARALYGYGDYVQAAQQYRMVDKRSNDLAASLSELSWAYLMAEKYNESIGTAMSMQAGGMRHTFAPEGPMVMAMALNEICQYPESVRAAAVFRKHYEDAFRWLARWKNEGKTSNLYPLALDFLRKTGKTPVRVASEWVKSPLFIASQDEINLLNQEKGAIAAMGKSGGVVQRQLAMQVVNLIKEIRPALKAAKAEAQKSRNPDEPLPPQLTAKLYDLRDKLVRYRRMQAGAPVWRTILASHQKSVQPTYQRLVAAINKDLQARNQRMLEQLDEIAENIQLVEVEIYNGASQDIIWQNSHPDYKKMLAKLETEGESAAASQVWDWGRSSNFVEESAEVWEDELGSFKADLNDNCSNRDRYLALKMKEKSK